MGILIDKTADSPYINFSEEGELELEGRSIMEDVYSFWQPLIDWIAEYTKSPAPNTRITFTLEYTNSSTNKYINQMLNLLDELRSRGNPVAVTWRYEEDDESILVLGQDLASLVSIPFRMEAVELQRLQMKKIKIKSKKTGNEATITLRYWDAILRNGHGEEYLVMEEIQ